MIVDSFSTYNDELDFIGIGRLNRFILPIEITIISFSFQLYSRFVRIALIESKEVRIFTKNKIYCEVSVGEAPKGSIDDDKIIVEKKLQKHIE